MRNLGPEGDSNRKLVRPSDARRVSRPSSDQQPSGAGVSTNTDLGESLTLLSPALPPAGLREAHAQSCTASVVVPLPYHFGTSAGNVLDQGFLGPTPGLPRLGRQRLNFHKVMVMRWKKATGSDGKILDRVAVSDVGYRVARFTIDGVDKYRPSLSGQFLHRGLPDPQEAKAVCERHYAITGGSI